MRDARPPEGDSPDGSQGSARRPRRASLRRLLLSITVLTGVVYGAFWVVWTWDHLGAERDKADAAVGRSADRAAAAFVGFLQATTGAASEAARDLRDATLTGPSCAVELANAFPLAEDGRPIGRYDLVGDDGSLVCTTVPPASTAAPAPDAAAVPWLAPDYEIGTRTAHYNDPATGRPVWAVAFPVGTGPEAAVLAAVVELGTASDQLAALFDDRFDTEFVVWDTASAEVLSAPEKATWTVDDPGRRIVATRTIPTTTWRLAAGAPRETAYAETWGEVRGGAVVLLAAMAALALVTTLVHRRIVRPLAAVTDAARRTAGGGTTELEESGPAELAELAGALNHLTASRARTEEMLLVTAADLAHSLERLDAVLANSADMVLIVNAEGKVTFASPAVAAVCGPAAAPGCAFADVVHPDDVPAAAALIRPGASGESAGELRVGSPEGGWRTVEVVARDLLSHPGVHGIIVNGRDVTDRVAAAAERAALDEQLHQSQRLESLGALAGGIAHDFKNLLSVIVWTADMVARDPAATAVAEDLDEMREAAARGVELAQQLLTFAKHDQALPEQIDVGAELLGLTDLLGRVLGDHIELDLRIAPSLPAVRVNRSRFDQAVVNLAVNARDAMGSGGRLVVEAGEQVTVVPGLDPGTYVEVSVTDTGAGMPPEVVRRAMEPFYTTKEPGQGTGLGLAIVHGIVTSAGGAVHIQSTPGRGTTVRLLLPASSEPSAAPGDGADAAPALGSGQVVLVVEDDDALRALVQRMLRAGNYTAVGAGDPAEALALAGRPDERIDVVLTDLLMPGMSGADLAARLCDKRPGLPVVFMSAYTADILEELVDGGARPTVLEKPFTQRQLLEALHRALTGERATSGR